jgi:helicase SWR1
VKTGNYLLRTPFVRSFLTFPCRAHRIGQVRDVHIYRFISRHTVEESMLKKANQKRSLDDLVIQKGEFDWRRILDDDVQMTKAFEQVEDKEDVEAAHNAANEISKDEMLNQREFDEAVGPDVENGGTGGKDVDGEDDDDVPPLARYMMSIVKRDWEYFSEWRIK